MKHETIARLALGLILAGAAAFPLAAYGLARRDIIEIHGRMAEAGGWTPAALTATVGQPLHLRLIADDVVHGFAVGQVEGTDVELLPGRPVETTLMFDQPGRYTFYCTRWCGLNHWRMRGVIEVIGPGKAVAPAGPPLYVQLGLDLDRPRPPAFSPASRPAARRGASLAFTLPTLDQTRGQSPAEVWQVLRSDTTNHTLSNADLWDIVAWLWRSQTTPAALAEGQRLYAANCAACHGEAGDGRGVFAPALARQAEHSQMEAGHQTQPPTAFTDPVEMLSASPALLQGKLIRGGMGTGMPAWGPILTDAQTWALIDYLWTFQFDYTETPEPHPLRLGLVGHHDKPLTFVTSEMAHVVQAIRRSEMPGKSLMLLVVSNPLPALIRLKYQGVSSCI